jgi:hypothetical protein
MQHKLLALIFIYCRHESVISPFILPLSQNIPWKLSHIQSRRGQGEQHRMHCNPPVLLRYEVLGIRTNQILWKLRVRHSKGCKRSQLHENGQRNVEFRPKAYNLNAYIFRCTLAFTCLSYQEKWDYRVYPLKYNWNNAWIQNVALSFTIKLKHCLFIYEGSDPLGVWFRINPETMTPLHIWQDNLEGRSVDHKTYTKEDKNNIEELGHTWMLRAKSNLLLRCSSSPTVYALN